MIVSNVSTSCVLGYLSPSFFYARSSIPLATLRRCNVTSIRLLCQLKIFLSAILRENQREEKFSSLARPWDRSTTGSSSSLCFYGITVGDEEIMPSTFSCCTTIGWNSRTFVLVNSSPGSPVLPTSELTAWKNTCGRFLDGERVRHRAGLWSRNINGKEFGR